MQKILLIAIGGVVVVGVAGLIILALLTRNVGQLPSASTGTQGQGTGGTYTTGGTSGTGSSNTTGSGTTTQVPTMTMTIEGGGTMVVKDITKDPALVADTSNPGIYYLGHHYSIAASSTTGSDNPPYVIEYIAETNYFNIALLVEPIAQTRLEAEQYLMQRLGISQANMCQLRYMVSVPNSVSQIYAGQDLRFSFCPGATRL